MVARALIGVAVADDDLLAAVYGFSDHCVPHLVLGAC